MRQRLSRRGAQSAERSESEKSLRKDAFLTLRSVRLCERSCQSTDIRVAFEIGHSSILSIFDGLCAFAVHAVYSARET